MNYTFDNNVSSLSTLTMDQNQKIEAEFSKISFQGPDKYKKISQIDCAKLLKNTDKELKGIKYRLSTIISNGDYHNVIDPRYEKQVEAIKETPIYCKIP